jgi:hypothetical protein
MSLLQKWFPEWLHWRRRDQRGAVLHQSVHQNIYHCTVQKSASQWIRRLLSDPRIRRYSGLESYQYQQQLPGKFDPRKLTDRRFVTAFPESTIATPLYVDYEGFASIPKPQRYKAFFVMRDPRDIVVSWYFSTKLSHKAQGDIERVRQELLRLTEVDGLRFSIDWLADYGLFGAQRSWLNAPSRDANVLLVRYEDLIGADQQSHIERLMLHCDIPISCDELGVVLAEYSFEQLSGRRRGNEDAHAHYRKGVAGDWLNHFDAAVHRHFHDVAGDLLPLWNFAELPDASAKV